MDSAPDELGEAARGNGFVSAHAWPLRLRANVIGALSLFVAEPREITEVDVHTGQALANVAIIGILAQRNAHQFEQLAAQLHALISRVAIEQAKGLAGRRRITVDEAFVVLRGHARSHNLRLSDLAREVTEDSNAAVELLGSRRR